MATQGTMKGYREYLKVSATRFNGDKATNHLKLSEVRMLNTILKHCASVTVERVETTEENYKNMFG